MGGLYQKRCGIAKEEPYTHWISGACHTDVVRGTFAPDEGTLEPKVRWFDIIRHNTDWKHGERLRLSGGWHDAADYDRRPMHLQMRRKYPCNQLHTHQHSLLHELYYFVQLHPSHIILIQVNL